MAAKERLRLESQIARRHAQLLSQREESVSRPDTASATSSSQQTPRHLVEGRRPWSNSRSLRNSQDVETLEYQLREKSQECETLTEDLSASVQHRQRIEQKVSSLVSENLLLITKLRELEDRSRNVEKITEECNTLKLSLVSAEKEKEAAREEIKFLNLRVNSLENVVRDLQESAERISQLERDKIAALQQLQQKQAQLEELRQVNSNIETTQAHTISSLSQMVEQCQDKMRQEEKRSHELTRDLQRLQQEAAQREKLLEELKLTKKALEKKQQESNLTTDNKRSNVISEAEHEQPDLKKSRKINQQQNNNVVSIRAQKWPVQAYIAKYNYDPFKLSPNENPEAELPLTAGDYVLVTGDMDEDGFFEGELADGSRGLVPSNYIQKLADDDLLEFHRAMLQTGHENSLNFIYKLASHNGPVSSVKSSQGKLSSQADVINNNGRNLNLHGSDDKSFSDVANRKPLGEIKSKNPTPQSTVEKNVQDSKRTGSTLDTTAVPCPRNLSLDKQLPNSIQVSWTGPGPVPGLTIDSYQVLVDGQVQSVIRSNERTRVVLEEVDARQIHRVSVRCISNQGESKDAQCTMLIGKDAYPAPSELHMFDITPTSASISWLPGNSNYPHTVYLNGEEVQTVMPGGVCYTLAGLLPGTLYTVTLRAKSTSGIQNEEWSKRWTTKVSASVELCTPELGFTSPLQFIDIEAAESSLPKVSLTTNNSAADLHSLEAKPAESSEAEQKGHETDEEIEEAFKDGEYTNDNEDDDTICDSYSESGRTELSDIPEVEEDLIGSRESHLNDAGRRLSAVVSAASQGEDRRMSVSSLPGQSLQRTSWGSQDLMSLQQGAKLHAPAAVIMRITSRSEDNLTVPQDDSKGSHNSSPAVSKKTLPSDGTSTFHKFDSVKFRNSLNEKETIKTEPTSSLPLELSTNKVNLRNQLNAEESQTKTLNQNGVIQSSQHRPSSPNSKHTKHLTWPFSAPIDDVDDTDSVSGETNTTVKANSVRYFVALFDYDPATMSPNLDTLDEELPFKGGQVLKVFGHKDADGFYKGECNGKMGYIPCNMVCEIQVEDPKILEQLLKDMSEDNEQLGQEQHSLSGGSTDDTSSLSKTGETLPRKMMALYDYDPFQLSPNMDVEKELSFKTGDIITVYGNIDEDGFYRGEINNKRGLVPSNFLQPFRSGESKIGSIRPQRSLVD